MRPSWLISTALQPPCAIQEYLRIGWLFDSLHPIGFANAWRKASDEHYAQSKFSVPDQRNILDLLKPSRNRLEWTRPERMHIMRLWGEQAPKNNIWSRSNGAKQAGDITVFQQDSRLFWVAWAEQQQEFDIQPASTRWIQISLLLAQSRQKKDFTHDAHTVHDTLQAPSRRDKLNDHSSLRTLKLIE